MNQILYHILYTQITTTKNEYSGHKIRETKITLKTFSTFNQNNSPVTENGAIVGSNASRLGRSSGQPRRFCTEQSSRAPCTALTMRSVTYYPETQEPWHLQSRNERLWGLLVQEEAKSFMSTRIVGHVRISIVRDLAPFQDPAKKANAFSYPIQTARNKKCVSFGILSLNSDVLRKRAFLCTLWGKMPIFVIGFIKLTLPALYPRG